MNSNTKACPKCGKYVEKNSGCNHIVCLCGQAFCWLCGGATGRRHDWNSIEGHSCSRCVSLALSASLSPSLRSAGCAPRLEQHRGAQLQPVRVSGPLRLSRECVSGADGVPQNTAGPRLGAPSWAY